MVLGTVEKVHSCGGMHLNGRKVTAHTLHRRIAACTACISRIGARTSHRRTHMCTAPRAVAIVPDASYIHCVAGAADAVAAVHGTAVTICHSVHVAGRSMCLRSHMHIKKSHRMSQGERACMPRHAAPRRLARRTRQRSLTAPHSSQRRSIALKKATHTIRAPYSIASRRISVAGASNRGAEAVLPR